jgi:hypothetical protein
MEHITKIERPGKSYQYLYCVIWLLLLHDWSIELGKNAGPTKMKRGLLQPGQERPMPALSLKMLLPPTDYYITYEGSATTPACQETSTWIVFNRPLYITEQQVLLIFFRCKCEWQQSVVISTCLSSFHNSCTSWEAWSGVRPIPITTRSNLHLFLRRPCLWLVIPWATITAPSNPLIIDPFALILTSLHQR